VRSQPEPAKAFTVSISGGDVDFSLGENVEVMTFIEQSLSRQVTGLRLRLPDLYDWRARVFFQIVQYSEASPQPTSSASALVWHGVAAAGAEAYRNKAPALSAWKKSLSSDPQFLRRKAIEFCTKAGREIRLHQDICSRLVK
jgi:hypothetical protein